MSTTRKVGEMILAGEPQPKQRPRCVFTGKHPRAITPPATEAAERLIAETYKEQNRDRPVEGAHGLELWLWFASAYGPSHRPDRMPDLDNLIKLVSDALNHIAWADDRQVTQIHAYLRRGVTDPHTTAVITTNAPQQISLIDEATEMSAEQYVKIRHRVTRRARQR